MVVADGVLLFIYGDKGNHHVCELPVHEYVVGCAMNCRCMHRSLRCIIIIIMHHHGHHHQLCITWCCTG